MSYQLIKSKLSSAFSKIGNLNGTSCPSSTDNRATIAHELFVADALASMASKRKDEAKKAAIEAGILGGDYVEASTVQVYDNEFVSISAKTATASETLDKVKLFSELIKELGADKASMILAAASKKNKPATSYIFATK
jgi:hypothetical protein